jgi:hypothetical protein
MAASAGDWHYQKGVISSLADEPATRKEEVEEP